MGALVEGAPAGAALEAALTRVTSIAPYLTAVVGAVPAWASGGPTTGDRAVPAEGEWVSAQALLDDPPWLGRIIRSAGIGLGTGDPAVAASAFVQSYSYRVLSLAVGCLVTAGVGVDVSAPRWATAWRGSWPSLVSIPDPRVLLPGAGVGQPALDSDTVTEALPFLVDTAVVSHLGPLVAAVRAGLGHPVGERLLWGDVAASAATAFRTMQGAYGQGVVALGARFFDLAPPNLRHLGAFWVVEEAGRRGWFWERTTCCLLDRLEGGIRCADCSLTPVAVRRAAYREALARS